MKSAIEEQLAFQIMAYKLPKPQREYRFHLERRFRFDFAWVGEKIAVECEGGVWMNGRHNRGSGFISDCEKYNYATRLGWQVYRFTGQDVSRGTAIKWLDGVFRDRRGSDKPGGTD